jgi:asparagine synthase (glutamine-hydrolysing)
MCGVAGIVAPNVVRYKGHLQQMTKSLVHRGPDGEGMHFYRSCALGHTRLSIIDLETGRQPMVSARSQCAISFNGEIYNYRKLKAAIGEYPFQTSSDTEVILALYEAHGAGAVSELIGMYAFAIWDDSRKELFCARDRFGEKPLFYAFGQNGEFLVASEIKAILASGLIRPVLSPEAICHYLSYLYVNACQTIYQNVFVLPPAHTLRYSNGKVTIERYWRLPQARPQPIGLQEAASELRALLDRAVARCLVADVPVGAFLSGGLDSSTVVALASKRQEKIKTFFFDFEDSSSELRYARDVAELYHTEHTTLSDKQAGVADLVITMQECFDEPFADSSNIPGWLIAKAARRYVKVVVGGDGGDELLGGYTHWYRPLWTMADGRTGGKKWTNKLECSVQSDSLLSSLVLAPIRRLFQRSRGGSDRSILDVHRAQRRYFTDEQLSGLGLCPPRAHSPTASGCGWSLDHVLRADIEDYLPGDILTKVDRTSMSHGLEVRSPFLDVDLATFAIGLPISLKMDEKGDKRLLHEAMGNMWPASLRTRGKQGFGAPVQVWIKRSDLKELKECYLNDRRQPLFGLLPFDRTREFIARDDYLTWILLVLAVWLDRHMAHGHDVASHG